MIVANLAKGSIGDFAAKAFGRLLICLLQGIAFRRANIDKSERIPLHLFCDELENFTSDTLAEILRESSKFRLLWTGAQQIVGSGLTPDMHKALIGSSNIKVAGATDKLYYKSEADLIGVEPHDIGSLGVGQFYCRIGNRPPFRFKTHTRLLGNTNAMTESEWKRLMAAQLTRYYRPITPTPPQTIIVPPEKAKPSITVTAERVTERLTVEVPADDMKPAEW